MSLMWPLDVVLIEVLLQYLRIVPSTWTVQALCNAGMPLTQDCPVIDSTTGHYNCIVLALGSLAHQHIARVSSRIHLCSAQWLEYALPHPSRNILEAFNIVTPLFLGHFRWHEPSNTQWTKVEVDIVCMCHWRVCTYLSCISALCYL